MNEKGFTLIELVVVMGILSLLSASLITYSRSGEKQIIFFKEQSVLTALIFQAKNLAISTYGRDNANSCGYGIHFVLSSDPQKPQEVVIFSDKSSLVDGCAGADGKYGSGEDFEGGKIILDSKVKIANSPADFIFIPPEPTVYPQAKVDIRLELVDDPGKSATISISSAGQITVQ